MNELFTPGAHGLIGPNGAGKTTYLTRYFQAHAGTGRVAMSQTGARNIFAGTVFGDQLQVIASAYPTFDRQRALDLVAAIGLTERSRFHTMSTGQRQLAAVATAIATNAPILLLDEPFNALDVTHRQRIREELIDLLAAREDQTLVVTSHRSEDLAGLVTDVTVINNFAHSPTYSLDITATNFPTLTGPTATVETFASSARGVISRKVLGGTTAVTLSSPLNDADLARALVHQVQVTYPTENELIDLLIGASNAH